MFIFSVKTFSKCCTKLHTRIGIKLPCLLLGNNNNREEYVLFLFQVVLGVVLEDSL